MNKEKNLEKVLNYPLVPVYYNADVETAKIVIKASFDAGIRVFEFTNRGPEALEIFGNLIKYRDQFFPEMSLGIGTIVDKNTAEKFIQHGADFIVQPGLTAEVGQVCNEAKLLWIPGVLTPTEIYAAQNLGAQMVKVFPANIMGPAYIKALRGPMPNIKIMVTGGVEATEASLHDWMGSGANVLGLGSQLFGKDLNLESLKTNVQNLFTIFKNTYQ